MNQKTDITTWARDFLSGYKPEAMFLKDDIQLSNGGGDQIIKAYDGTAALISISARCAVKQASYVEQDNLAHLNLAESLVCTNQLMFLCCYKAMEQRLDKILPELTPEYLQKNLPLMYRICFVLEHQMSCRKNINNEDFFSEAAIVRISEGRTAYHFSAAINHWDERGGLYRGNARYAVLKG
ncbi:FcoT family thioesterase [Parendozoicomonas haliclonae]|uniref:(2E)-enoyl-[ACP] glycyltransferase n=1 Tax=Parendozoicomonas haliclonae TaxID=1960125 RepID=A0A1X7AET9_9GAMM|nr:FcoT family thioesterase [Parendozoicomonas haliclonae]SMA35515.1 FcoT-like thioesterase domain protein [Parendozoicomonas haliclonae]